MRFKTHLAFTFFLFLVSWPLIEDFTGEKWIFALFFLIFGVFPDIDTTKSRLGRFFPVGRALKHRGVFHSIWPAVFFSVIVEIFFAGYGLAVFLGYFSHLVLDMLNFQGVGLFYPVIKFRVKGPLKATGLADRLLFLVFLCFIIVISLISF
ncbi:MAG: metal-dependent hydrolase [Candidatus Nanoarchaeia archaeon]